MCSIDSKKPVYVHHPVDRDDPVLLDKDVGGSTAVLVGGEPDLRPPGVGLDQVGEREDAGERVEIVLPEDAAHLLLDIPEDIGDGDPAFLEVVIARCAGKSDRLEVHTAYNRDMVYGKLDDIAELVVVPPADHCRHEHDPEPHLFEVLDRFFMDP